MSNNREYLIPRDTIKVQDNEFPTMWNGYRFGNFGEFAEYKNDFHVYTAANWTATVVGTGTAAPVAGRNGILRLLNSAADNDNVNLQLTASGVSAVSFAPLSGKAIFYETKISISDATQSDFAVGLVIADTDVITSIADGIIFKKDDGDALLDFQTTKSSASSSDTGIHTVVANVDIVLGFKVTGSSQVEYYVNGIKKGTFTTNIPTANTTITFAIQNGEAVAKSMDIDYVIAAQER